MQERGPPVAGLDNPDLKDIKSNEFNLRVRILSEADSNSSIEGLVKSFKTTDTVGPNKEHKLDRNCLVT